MKNLGSMHVDVIEILRFALNDMICFYALFEASGTVVGYFPSSEGVSGITFFSSGVYPLV